MPAETNPGAPDLSGNPVVPVIDACKELQARFQDPFLNGVSKSIALAEDSDGGWYARVDLGAELSPEQAVSLAEGVDATVRYFKDGQLVFGSPLPHKILILSAQGQGLVQ